MTLAPFDFHQPPTLEGVIEALGQYGSEASLLAGGTALLIDLQHGELTPSHVISLWGVKQLAELRRNGEFHIGSLATMTDLAKAINPGEPGWAGLREAALQVGGRQIQNMATVGGNLCKASPGADLVPPLLCLDAVLSLTGQRGERVLPLDGFLTGPDQTALMPGEVLRAVRLPPTPPHTGTAFIKIMRRRAVDCSIVSVAARVTLADDLQTSSQVRIGVAAAAPNPFRARRAEARLEGERLDPKLAAEAGRLAQEDSHPIDDVRASAGYRGTLVETLVARALLVAKQRAEEA